MQFLHSGFLESARAMPNRPALNVGGRTLAYQELLEHALRIAATIERRQNEASRLTGVFSDRSACGFAGIIGALLAGHGYVPLNPNFPVARTRRMLQRSGCTTLVVDADAIRQLDDLLGDIKSSLTIILPETLEVETLAARWPQHSFVAASALEASWSWQPVTQSVDEVAYVLFTSGSTGEPKGVPVTHANVTHFVNTMVDRYAIGADDRFSQMFDTTFDLSVFDLFVAWSRGACVYCPPRATLLNPDAFIRDNGLTIWFSVPSVGMVMQRFGALKAGRYPSLRWSLFCGEPLPVALAERWSAAAPASVLENLYGPTELTVACAAYRWDPAASVAESSDGVVPIGAPLAGMQARVVDDCLREVAPGEVGELVMSGPQRTRGYWHDEVATGRAHISLPRDSGVYYRTGDRVRRPEPGAPLTYVGRLDHQIKVLGHRLELGEVESALRSEPGVDAAVALAWPLTSAGAAGIAAFVTGEGLDLAAIRANVRTKLQSHAVPQTIQVLPEFPQNTNGKVDREALRRLLGA